LWPAEWFGVVVHGLLHRVLGLGFSIRASVYSVGIQIAPGKKFATEPRPQTCAENFVKFGHVILEICERTDIQTSSSQYFAPVPGAK